MRNMRKKKMFRLSDCIFTIGYLVDIILCIIVGIPCLLIKAIISIVDFILTRLRCIVFLIFEPYILVIPILVLCEHLPKPILKFIKTAINQLHTILPRPIMLIIIFIVVFFIVSFVILLLKTFAELISYLPRFTEPYQQYQKIQQGFNNYALLFISSAALFVAVLPSAAEEWNPIILILDLLYLLAIVFNDVYRVFISEPGYVKELSTKIKEIWTEIARIWVNN